MKLRIRAFGLALGIVVGFGFFVGTLYSMIFGHGGTFVQIQPLFGPLASRSILGAFFGLVWGVIWGFVAGGLVAWLYNLFHKALYKSTPAN